MGRILQLIPTYGLSLKRVGPGPRSRRALRAELSRLESGPLPGPGDFEAFLSLPAVGVAWARAVPDVELWVLYRISELHVSLWEVTEQEPMRAEPLTD